MMPLQCHNIWASACIGAGFVALRLITLDITKINGQFESNRYDDFI